MGTRQRPLDIGDRIADRAIGTLGDEIRRARRSAGLSQEAVANAAGVSHTTVSRIERGRAGDVRLRLLARLMAAVGLDLAARAYPGPDPIRDAAHAALLERLRARLGPGLRWQTEVPLPLRGDLRAWDAVISSEGHRVGIECETRVEDVQALVRRIALKRRDGDVAAVIIVVADTNHNREVLSVAGGVIRAELPGDTRMTLRDLSAGRLPKSCALVLLRPSDASVRPRPHPTMVQ